MFTRFDFVHDHFAFAARNLICLASHVSHFRYASSLVSTSSVSVSRLFNIMIRGTFSFDVSLLTTLRTQSHLKKLHFPAVSNPDDRSGPPSNPLALSFFLMIMTSGRSVFLSSTALVLFPFPADVATGPSGSLSRIGWFLQERVTNNSNSIVDHWRAFQRPDMAQVFNYTDVEVLELMQLLRDGDRSVILGQELTDEAAPLDELLSRK